MCIFDGILVTFKLCNGKLPQEISEFACLRLVENVFAGILIYTKTLQILFNISVVFQGLGILVS